jgi:hypothetical protein
MRLRHSVRTVCFANLHAYVRYSCIFWGHDTESKITSDKTEGRRRVGRPNLRWMDGMMRDAERLGVRNWRSKAKDRVGWKRLLESVKTLHGL